MSDWKIIIPEAGENLIPANPSVEDGTTGWTKGGSNTIIQSSAQAKFGDYSALCTWVDSTVIVGINSITLTAAAHAFSAWVYLDSAWDGGNVKLQLSGFTSATIDTASTSTATTDKWVRLELLFTPDGGDLTGNVEVFTDSAPSSSGTGKIYIDAVQVEAVGYATTYIDGDQPGCWWTGAKHASKSKRSQHERGGGRILDFVDDLGLKGPLRLSGVGKSRISNIILPYALQQGGLFQSVKSSIRKFSLLPAIIESSATNYHSTRQALAKAIDLTNSNILRDQQSCVIRYTGADEDKEIGAAYSEGLEVQGPDKFNEKVALSFESADPSWKMVGENSAILDTEDTATFDYIAGRIDGAWSNMGSLTLGGNADIRCAVATADYIYIGGDFTNAAGLSSDYMVKWNKETQAWETMGTGGTGPVNALAVAPNGDIYLCGNFVNWGGIGDADYLAYRDISTDTWSAVSSGGSGEVKDLAFAADGTLYFCGSFTDWNSVGNADRIASWDGSTYAALSTGGDVGTIEAVAVSPNGNVFFAGSTTTMGGVTVNGIGEWDGSAFAALDNGISATPTINDLIVLNDGTLYVAGNFTAVDGDGDLKYIVKWNGSVFSSLDTAPDAQVLSMAVTGDGRLIAGGDFTTIGQLGPPAVMNYKGEWSGDTWSILDISLAGTPSIGVALADNINEERDDIYLAFDAAGSSTYAGSTTIAYGGTDIAYPKIHIKRTGGTNAKLLSITNDTTGARLLFAYDLLDGEELIIDLRPGHRKMVSSFVGERWNIIPNSDISRFFLVPSNGSGTKDNVITTHIFNTGSTITASIRWKDAYTSLD